MSVASCGRCLSGPGAAWGEIHSAPARVARPGHEGDLHRRAGPSAPYVDGRTTASWERPRDDAPTTGPAQAPSQSQADAEPVNSRSYVLTAGLIGTTIECYDFYGYATAAVLVFPKLFFPSSDPAMALLSVGSAQDEHGDDHRRRRDAGTSSTVAVLVHRPGA